MQCPNPALITARPSSVEVSDVIYDKITTRDRRLCLKPMLARNKDYMVEKTYQLAPYVGAFGAYLEPQLILYGSNGVSIYQDRCNVAVNSHYLPSGQKTISFGQKRPKRLYD